MSDEGSVDGRLALGWQALSPPSGAKARVRERLLGGTAVSSDDASGALSEALPPGENVSSAGGGAPHGALRSETGAAGVLRRAAGLSTRWALRWRALKGSGLLGVGVGSVLLALGFAAGYLLQPATRAPEAASATARASERAAPALLIEAPLSRTAAPSVTPPSVGEPSAAAVTSTTGRASITVPASATAQPNTSVPRSVSSHAVASRSVALHSGRAARHSSPPPRATRATGARARAPQPHASSPGDELRLLERAERAVRTGHAALTLALIRELDASLPRSTLLEERRALELMALCHASEPERAARAADFARRYPSSVYGTRIEAECRTNK